MKLTRYRRSCKSQCKQLAQFFFQVVNGIQTHVLSVSAAMLYQLSYEDTYVGSRPIIYQGHHG